MSEPFLSLHQVNFKVSGRLLVSHITFELFSKHMMTLVGPNGAGKSTLLKLIVGLLKPTSGTLRFSKKNPVIGYMPQRLSLDQTLPLTVGRFLSLSQGSLSSEAALQKVGAEKLKERSIHSLSGGEFQRVLLAKAILRNPDFLVLDEPTQGLDTQGQSTFYALLNEVRQELKCTVLLVSHDLYFVHAASDSVICLNQHICCAGHPQEIASNPDYRALFQTMIPSGVVPYSHHHDHTHEETLEKEKSLC